MPKKRMMKRRRTRKTARVIMLVLVSVSRFVREWRSWLRLRLRLRETEVKVRRFFALRNLGASAIGGIFVFFFALCTTIFFSSVG